MFTRAHTIWAHGRTTGVVMGITVTDGDSGSKAKKNASKGGIEVACNLNQRAI